MPEGIDEIDGMEIVSYLLPFIAENRVRLSAHPGFDKIGKEAVQLCTGMGRSGETSSAKNTSFKSKISAVLLYQKIPGRFTYSKQAVGGGIDRHRLINPTLRVPM